MAQKTPDELLKIANTLYLNRYETPLEYVTIDGVPYRFPTLVVAFAEAVFKKECNRTDPVILNHIANTTAKPIYDAGIFIMKESYENYIMAVYDDYRLTKNLQDTYSLGIGVVELWKLYILFLTVASAYYKNGYLVEPINYSYYYPPLKPAQQPTTTPTPAVSSPKPATKTRQQLIDEVGNYANNFKYQRGTCSTKSCLISSKRGDCWAFSDLIYHELEKRGINARIVNYKTSLSQNHRTVQIWTGSAWKHFDYKKYGLSRMLYPTSNWVNGYILSGHK